MKSVSGKGDAKMNFNNKKTRRTIAVIIMIVIIAMVATSIIPSLMM